MKLKANITRDDLEPVQLFNTPENWVELNKWIMAHTDYQERMHIMTAAYMAWNLACAIVNDEASNDDK